MPPGVALSLWQPFHWSLQLPAGLAYPMDESSQERAMLELRVLQDAFGITGLCDRGKYSRIFFLESSSGLVWKGH